ncbi:MAG: carboxypeptidase regulatory-like domain-containing protein [bacterium]
MKDKWKTCLATLLGVALSAFVIGPVQAQDVDVLVTPEEAVVEPGEGLQLEVFAFSLLNDARRPVDVEEITWSVEPDTLGTVTDDGFFIAGRNVGVVVIKVVIRVRGHTIVKEVVIRIGRLPKPRIRLEVVPNHAVIPIGSHKQFEAVLFNKNESKPVPPEHVRWQVRPERLGDMNDEGVFTAGDRLGHGHVVAHVEIDGLRLRAAAKVWVSPPPSAAIEGNITNDADNAPIEDAVVRAVRLGRIPWIRRTRSDADGNYRLGELIPGVYVVHARAKGFIGEFYDDTRNYLEATPLNLAENDTADGIDFGLSEGGKIAGTVIADSDSLPLGGVHVVAFLVVKPRFARHVLTNDDGSYVVEALPTGTYAVRANKPGYKGEFFDDARKIEDAQFVPVVEPETVPDIDFGLATASAISGVVTDAADGAPIAGAHVKVFRLAAVAVVDRHFVRETRTNDRGEYIVQIRPGTYLVKAGARGYNAEFYDDARNRASATPVVVAPDSHTTDIDFDLVKRSSIAGTVLDQVTGEPIAGAIVQAFKERPDRDLALAHDGFRAETDSLGSYLIENVPSGNYILLAWAHGYLREFFREANNKGDAEIVPVGDSTKVEGIDFTLEHGGSIAGLVATEGDSIPIPRALVKVIHAESGRFIRTFTNEEGHYKVGGLPTGLYLVRVIAEGFFPEFYDNARRRRDATRIEVTAPELTAGINVYLEQHVDRRGTIAGRVFSDRDDSPLFGAVVVAVSPKRRVPHITFTGPRGHYRLTDLPAGKYFVFAWAEGFIGEFFKDARRFENADPVFVHANEVTDGISFGLHPAEQPGLYAIRGRILAKADGSSIEGILVQATLDNNVQVNAMTDADGNYVIIGLPAGEYKIEATGAGYVNGHFGGTDETNSVPVAVGSGQDADGIDMELDFDNITNVNSDGAAVPERFDLLQNYPNPFNPTTAIKYHLPQSGEVTLKIFNLLGQQVRTLVNKPQQAGTYTVTWDGKSDLGRPVASGIYIYRIEAGDTFDMSKRMLLLK